MDKTLVFNRNTLKNAGIILTLFWFVNCISANKIKKNIGVEDFIGNYKSGTCYGCCACGGAIIWFLSIAENHTYKIKAIGYNRDSLLGVEYKGVWKLKNNYIYMKNVDSKLIDERVYGKEARIKKRFKNKFWVEVNKTHGFTLKGKNGNFYKCIE